MALLPTAKRFRDLLESQVRREVTVGPADPLPPTERRLWFAIYVDAHLATQAVAVTDLAAAAHIGAAVGLVPVGVADAAVTDGVLPVVIADGFRSVLEAWATLFTSSEGDETHLYRATPPDTAPPADVVSLAAAPGKRLDLAVTIRAYGQGHVSLVLAR